MLPARDMITGRAVPGHPRDMDASFAVERPDAGAPLGEGGEAAPRSATPDRRRPAPVDAGGTPTFEQIYDAEAAFVWRSLRRLGVQPASIEDAVQDVFVVVHRRLGEFEGRSQIRTWLFGIVLRVARTHRRTVQRKRLDKRAEDVELDALPDVEGAPGPEQRAERTQAMKVLYELLEKLDEDKREVFVMAELEGLSGPEIAETLGANLNTVYARLRAARIAFEQAVARHLARDRRRIG